MFYLTGEQLAKLRTWKADQDKIVIERQRISMKPEEFADLTMDGEFPYYGAIGGALTYMFTPTGIGTFITVKHSGTEETINLTNYDEL